ncbi:Archease [Olavius algarvensis Delta 1 endosymbiont]|nr:Archease [Olavius algarvensis Delta 1 endosymbiont]
MTGDMPFVGARPFHGAAFKEIEHTADRALKIYGSDLTQLLCNAADGMNSLLAPRFDTSNGQQIKPVALEAIDAESLLVEWLSELAYWAESELLVFHRFDLHSVSPTHIRATVYGRRASKLECHIKAVTYHDLKIIETDAGLLATVVFDV